MEQVFGSGFMGHIIGIEGNKVIIESEYASFGAKIGDPCRIDPYKYEKNESNRHNGMETTKTIKQRAEWASRSRK